LKQFIVAFGEDATEKFTSSPTHSTLKGNNGKVWKLGALIGAHETIGYCGTGGSCCFPLRLRPKEFARDRWWDASAQLQEARRDFERA
jgi:hypothetical protein